MNTVSRRAFGIVAMVSVEYEDGDFSLVLRVLRIV